MYLTVKDSQVIPRLKSMQQTFKHEVKDGFRQINEEAKKIDEKK